MSAKRRARRRAYIDAVGDLWVRAIDATVSVGCFGIVLGAVVVLVKVLWEALK